MDDFETFKASREKIDPSCRKFSDRQWRKAYAAYRRARERVGDGAHAKSGESSKRRRSPGRESSSHHNYAQNPAIHFRNQVRQNSAYSDLRMILDILAWVMIGLIVLGGGIKLAYYTDGSIALAALLDAAVKVIVVAVLRLLAHAIVDIPDIAIYKQLSKQTDPHKDPAASI